MLSSDFIISSMGKLSHFSGITDRALAGMFGRVFGAFSGTKKAAAFLPPKTKRPAQAEAHAGISQVFENRPFVLPHDAFHGAVVEFDFLC